MLIANTYSGLGWFKFTWAAGKTVYPGADNQETTTAADGRAPAGKAVVLHRIITLFGCNGSAFTVADGAGVAYAGGNVFRNPSATGGATTIGDNQLTMLGIGNSTDLDLYLPNGLSITLAVGTGDAICVYAVLP